MNSQSSFQMISHHETALRVTFSVTVFARHFFLPTVTFCRSWPSLDASRGGSGGDTDLEQSLARAEKRCALNLHFRIRTRLRSTPCCSGFLPDGDEQFRREGAQRT